MNKIILRGKKKEKKRKLGQKGRLAQAAKANQALSLSQLATNVASRAHKTAATRQLENALASVKESHTHQNFNIPLKRHLITIKNLN